MTARPHRAAWAAFVLALALIASVANPGRAADTPLTETHSETLAGKLLVAAPSIRDGYFAQSVVYMLHHDETGALGVVVNIPMGVLPFASIFEGLGIEPGIDSDLADRPVRIYSGGPVDAAQGFVLHPDDYRGADNADDPLVEAGGLALSMSIELMRSIAAGHGPERSLLLFGYAGWGPGQLEQELRRDDWVAVTTDENLVFDSDDGTKWRRAMDRLEIDL